MSVVHLSTDALHTSGFMSACDEHDEEQDEEQQQEGGEDATHRQEKVVPLVGQNHVDDWRGLGLGGVWATRRAQGSASGDPHKNAPFCPT